MKRKELARELARTTHTAPAAAQDLVDEMVADIMRKLRAGERVDLAEIEKMAREGKLKVRPAVSHDA